MKRVPLINTAFPTEFETFYHLRPPLGLLTISASLAKAGYDVILVDPQFEENYKDTKKTLIDKGVLSVGTSSGSIL